MFKYKQTYTVQQEMEFYEAIHKLNEKYGETFLDWYNMNCVVICGNLPTIIKPQNQMEQQVMLFNHSINNPRHYSYKEICEFEEKVCKWLSSTISLINIIGDEKKQMKHFYERYHYFRVYYIVKLEI